MVFLQPKNFQNQAQVHNKNSKAESTQVNDYLKIYGIGKSGPQQQKNISKNSLKMKLDPIGGKLQGMDGGKPQGMELPKILSGAGGRYIFFLKIQIA